MEKKLESRAAIFTSEDKEFFREVLKCMNKEYLFIGLDEIETDDVERIGMIFGGADGNPQYVNHVLDGIAGVICHMVDQEVHQNEKITLAEMVLAAEELTEQIRDFAMAYMSALK